MLLGIKQALNRAKTTKVKVFQIIILATNKMMKQAIRVDMCLCVLLSDVAHLEALMCSDEINGFLASC